jgi:hypothetical protein
VQTIQSGEIGERLRRALRLVGESPSAVEGVVNPIIQVLDAGQLPYRQEPLRWTEYDVSAAVAAQFGFVALYLNDADQQMALIERVQVAVDVAAGAGIVINMSIARTADLPAGTDSQTSLTEPVTFDGTNVRRALPRTRFWNSAAFVANSISIGTAHIPTGSFKDPSGTWSEAALPVLLQPGTALVVNIGTVNLAWRMWATGVTWRHPYGAPA